MEKEERDLVERSIRGDRDAFAALYERSFGPVYAFVVSEVSDFDEARSICQETFLRAWNGLKGLKEPAAFGGWIRTIARNEISRFRARPQTRAAARNVPIEDVAEPADGRAVDPAGAAAQREFEDAVRDELRDSPPVQREAVLLRVLAGLEYNEIATRLDIGLNEGKGLVIRGVAKLADRLERRLGKEPS